MRKVYKYKLYSHTNEFEFPEDAKIVLVGTDGQNVGCVWVELDEDEALVKQQVFVFGTGFDIVDGTLEHIGSYRDGLLIWHVYIKREWR